MAAHLDAMFARFARTGDPEALAFVFERTATGLARRARRLLGCGRAAEDVVQDLFLSLLSNGNRYDCTRPCRPFLVGALHRHALRWRRARERQPVGPLPDGARSHAEPPESILRASEFAAAVRAAVGGLPGPGREVVRRYLELHETPQEIGRALGRRAGTVRVQLHRGLRELRSRLPQGFLALGLAMLVRPASAAPRTGLPLRARWLAAGAAIVAVAFVQELAPATRSVAAAPVAAGPQALVTGRSDVADATDQRTVVGEPGRASGRLRLQFADGSEAAGIGVLACEPGRDPDFAGRRLCSDAAGTVALEDLAPGKLEIGTDRGTHTLVTLQPGANQDVAIRLPAGSTVRGRVVDAAGAPVAGAALWVCHEPRHPWNGQVTAHADAAGAFELRDLPAMTTFAAIAPGFVPSAQQVAGPRARSGIVLQLGGPAASVTGIVRGPDGTPLPGAVVRAARHPRSQFLLPGGDQFAELLPTVEVRTDAEGRFRCGGLPAGRVEVSVRAAACASALVPSCLQAGEARAITVRLRPGCSLQGRVRDAAGQPVADAGVVAHGRAQQEWSGVDVAADGTFHLAGVAPERILLEVSAPGFTTRELPVACGQTLDVELERVAVVRGRLGAAGGGTIEAGAFELGCRDGDPEQCGARSPVVVALDADGGFTAPVQGTFFCRRTGSAVWLPCTVAGRTEDEVILRVPDGADAACALTVCLRGFTAAQVADAMVLLVRDGEVYRATPSAEDAPGEVTVGLPAGEYEVSVFGQRGLCPACSAGKVAATAAAVRVEVAAPPSGTVCYRLGTGVQLCRGYVVDERGLQVPLQKPRGVLALGVGRYHLWASSLSFMTVRGLPFEVQQGTETVLVPPLRAGVVRHVAFTLPAGVAAASATLRLSCHGELVLGDEPGLRECGFDAFADGFCRTAVVLAADDYQLELRAGAGCWRGSFTVSGDDGTIDPVLVALAGN